MRIGRITMGSLRNRSHDKPLPGDDADDDAVNEPDLPEWAVYNGASQPLIHGLVGKIRARQTLSTVQAAGDHRACMRNVNTGETISW